jgi:hypothetical protein
MLHCDQWYTLWHNHAKRVHDDSGCYFTCALCEFWLCCLTKAQRAEIGVVKCLELTRCDSLASYKDSNQTKKQKNKGFGAPYSRISAKGRSSLN